MPHDLEVSVRNLFRGHELGERAEFRISGEGDRGRTEVVATAWRSVGEELSETRKPVERLEKGDSTTGASDSRRHGHRLMIGFDTYSGYSSYAVGLTPTGGLAANVFESPAADSPLGATPAQLVPTDSISRLDLVAMFEEVVLTPDEQAILDALRIIEPGLERIAPITSDLRHSPASDRGGIVVKLRGQPQRVPIESMGDGMWRMLGVVLSMVRARGGILLVDEIDTGLHHTVMADLWRLVYETAKRLDVQVFATTHSRDCVDSLAAIARPDAHEAGEISIQRIERGKDRAISYSEREIVIAAERGIEVR